MAEMSVGPGSREDGFPASFKKATSRLYMPADAIPEVRRVDAITAFVLNTTVIERIFGPVGEPTEAMVLLPSRSPP